MSNSNKLTAGINGFGRFGLGLFRAWFFDSNNEYDISFINDDIIDVQKIVSILKTDPIVNDFRDFSISAKDNILSIAKIDGHCLQIVVTKGPIESASWIGVPDVLFECSGITRNHSNCRNLLISKTKNIIVGSIIENSDAILVMGYNHMEYDKNIHRIISFGSCTVIPGIHIVSWVEKNFKSKQCTINTIHSVPKWQLDSGQWTTIERKTCSLEKVVPKIIHTIKPEEIKVNYTYAPYYGASLMDFEFTIAKKVTIAEFTDFLIKEINEGSFKDIVSLVNNDDGANNHINSRFSMDIIKSSIDIRNDRIYFFGYFNNEGSGIRLHELAKYIISENNK